MRSLIDGSDLAIWVGSVIFLIQRGMGQFTDSMVSAPSLSVVLLCWWCSKVTSTVWPGVACADWDFFWSYYDLGFLIAIFPAQKCQGSPSAACCILPHPLSLQWWPVAERWRASLQSDFEVWPSLAIEVRKYGYSLAALDLFSDFALMSDLFWLLFTRLSVIMSCYWYAKCRVLPLFNLFSLFDSALSMESSTKGKLEDEEETSSFSHE